MKHNLMTTLNAIALIAALSSTSGCRPKKNDADSKSIDTIKTGSESSLLHCGTDATGPDYPESPEEAVNLQRKAIPEFITRVFQEGPDYSIVLDDNADATCKDLITTQAQKLGMKVDPATLRTSGCVDAQKNRIILPKISKRIHEVTLPLLWELFSEHYIAVLSETVSKLPPDSQIQDENQRKFAEFTKQAAVKLPEMEKTLGDLTTEVLNVDALKDRREKLENTLIPQSGPQKGSRQTLNRYYSSELFHSYYCSYQSRNIFASSSFKKAYDSMRGYESLLGLPFYMKKH